VLSLDELSDRAEITDVVHRYAVGVAGRDVDLLVGLFTDDAVLDYYGRPPLRGADEVRALFAGRVPPLDPDHEPYPFATHLASVPLVTNVLVEVDGDRAVVDSYCLATHAGTGEDGGRVVLRATRNLDRFVRTPGGWLIAERRHELAWALEAPAEVGVAHRPTS
jgi:ketosteroid isomerase-like protein